MMLDPESVVELVRLEREARLRKQIPLDLELPPRPSLLAAVKEFWTRLWGSTPTACTACCASCETAH